MVKCLINQIAALIKVSILKATNSVSVCSVVGVHVGIAAIEVEVARIGAANRTAPIVAAATAADRTIGTAALARHGQFERGGKSPNIIILAPT